MAVLLARGQITIAAIKDGKDGITWTLTPDILTYDTDDSGKAINVGTGKATTLRVLRGNEELTNFTIKGVKNMVNCVASRQNNTSSFYISAITVQKVTLGTDTMDVSCTNGSFDVEFAVDGVTYTATAKFAVNVSAFTGRMTLNNKQYEAKFTEISNKFNKDLADAESRITQSAREISLSVSEKSIGRRNLLVGSAFLREDNNCIISNDARIEINSGYQGTNCIHVIDATEAGNPHYVGAYWDGSQGGRSIKIEKGKKYTMSCFYKTNDINAEFYLEAIYTDKQENATRKGQAKYLSPSEHTVKKVNEWELFTMVVDTTDAEYDYIAFNFWEACNVIAGQINAWICRPMVEEGDTYNGWTLSQNDYGIIGANLIDNSRTLDVGGNVLLANGKKALVGDAYELTASGSDDYNPFYRIKGSTFKLNTDYTISFEVRGDAKYMLVNAFYPITNTPFTYYAEQKNDTMFERKGDGKTNAYEILMEVKELSKQQKVWCHFRFKDRVPEQIYFQFQGNTEQTGVTSWNVTITKPKIEVGAVFTEYTEKKTDLIDKSTAKAAGLEITADGVELYGNKVKVKNNGKTAAMFTDGKLNADLIDADTINVHHVWAKDSNNQNTLAHFGNYDIDEAKDEDGKQYPLWVGSSTVADSPFRVSKDGYMYADKGAFGVRYYEDEDSGTRKKFGRFEITGEGLSSGAVFKEDSMMLTDTRFQLIKAEGRSAIFIDTDQTLAVPGPGTYLSAKMRVDAIDTTDGYHSNVCYFAEAKNGVQNYALRGIGDVSVNGGVYGYKYTMINMTTKNVFLDNTGSFRGTTYNEVQKIDSLTLIVSSKKYLALALPTLGTIKQILFGSKYVDDKFCVRLTIVMDIGSKSIAMRGRCTTKDGADVAQWNTKDLPLITHWNGDYWADFDMAAGDSYEFLLTYNPDKSYTLGGFTQPYLARIINRQN